MTTKPLPTLGIYTPLPGTASGIADYAGHTAGLLADRYQVIFVSISNFMPPDAFDHVLYHIGNGRDCVAAYRALCQRPGPVILHEFVLSQFFIENHDILDDATNAHVTATFAAALGQDIGSSAALERLMRNERHRELHYMDLGLESMIVNRATTVLVHSPLAASSLQDRHGCSVRTLDFPVQPTPPPISRRKIYESLGVSESAVLFGSFGFVGTNKRLPAVLHAWQELAICPDVGHLLLVGTGTRILRQVSRAISTLDYIDDSTEFAALQATVDVGIQLRWPTLGETSGVVSSFLANGIQVIVSTPSILPAWASPDLVTVVEPDQREHQQLMATITRKSARNQVSHRAQRPTSNDGWRRDVLAALSHPAGR